MIRIIIFYVICSAIWFVVNFNRYIRCAYYQTVYNINLDNNNGNKNYSIKEPVYHLLMKAHILPLSSDIDVIAETCYRSQFNNAFDNAKGYFKHRKNRFLIWIFLLLNSAFARLSISKTGNKIISVILAVLSMFVAYFLGLYLDTTGIGNKILECLLSNLTLLFHYPK